VFSEIERWLRQKEVKMAPTEKCHARLIELVQGADQGKTKTGHAAEPDRGMMLGVSDMELGEIRR
jgi:hypothetical protein